MKHPKTVQLYETRSGATVKTLDEWKFAEITQLLPPELATSVVHIVNHADALIEILSVREKGRPLNRKDSKPRKPRVVSNEGKAA